MKVLMRAAALAIGVSAAFAARAAPTEWEVDAFRLLRQATFGPTDAEVRRAAAMGPEAWVDEQLAFAPSRYPDYPWVAANRPASCVDDRTLPVREDSYCARDNYTLFPLQLQFFRTALTARDQLRQRVAFALSQILVTSGVKNARNYAMARYQQLLVDHAFADFEQLLAAVTLSPMMGDYLDMANNNKANAATGVEPNENYAREILQLFSVGTYRLAPDGTRLPDAFGNPQPTYDQEEIEGYAHVFTGWTYPAVEGAASRNNNPRNFLGRLQPVAANHDFGAKALLDDGLAPPGRDMESDLALALSTIARHPNVAPFIGRQLIQKLVKSDPSPDYVARISAVWEDDGTGRRGHLGAVVRAILLDPEARGPFPAEAASGKLLEPVLFVTQMARALGVRSDGAAPRSLAAGLSQNVFYPPTVFNYYPADYALAGSGAPAPEFGLLNSATAVARANAVNGWVYSNGIGADASIYGATGTQFDLSPYVAAAGVTANLLDLVDRNLMGGGMTPAMRASISGAVNALAATDGLGRARAAVYLVLASPHFQVQR